MMCPVMVYAYVLMCARARVHKVLEDKEQGRGGRRVIGREKDREFRR